jgi:hypothetical protein
LGIKGGVMTAATFVIDESGAKGYSDNREGHLGELGVMAGFLIPNEYLEKVESEITSITNNYLIDGKLHITDLESNDQESLRNNIFDYLLSVRAFWTYEAMYVEGFYNNAQHVLDMVNKANSSRRSNVKISSNEKRDLLHSELFLGTFGKGVAFCIDNISQEFQLNVITDHVDKSILKLFNDSAQRLLSVGQRKEHKVTGYNPDTGTVVKGSVVSEITQGKELLGDFFGVKYDIKVSDSPLTVAADVLVNSVHHHLSSLQKVTPGCQLNTIESIIDHPLSSIVYGITDSSSIMSQVADTIYRHPNQS